MTKFHIVVPVLNQQLFIRDALASLVEEGRTSAIDVIVVDGGSSDGTLAEIEQVLDGVHAITVISEPDDGQTAAIQKGMALGTGDIVGWLNGDDRLVRGTLARVLPRFEDGVAAVYGDTRYIDESGQPLFDLREQDFSRHDLLWGPCYVPQPSTFVARWAWDQVGGLRPHLDYAMDLDLWLRLSKVGRIVHLPEILSEFRVHPRSKSVADALAARREANAIRREHLTEELQRVPSRLEMEARRFVVRCRRKWRAAARQRTARR